MARGTPTMIPALPLLPPLPPDGERRLTGLACPDCAGSLLVRVDHKQVTFFCWIGHEYSLGEMLAAKEEALEKRLWVAYSSLEEIAIIMDELEASGFQLSDPAAYRHRGAVARTQANQRRPAIESDRPLIPLAAEDHSLKDPP